MDILYKDDALEKLCSQERVMNKKFGKIGAKKLRARLADLQAAEHMMQVKRGRPHLLKGDLKGCIALDLDSGNRLVLEAANKPLPRHDDQSIDWNRVTAVCVVFIGDYHD
jgi:proteic killer suppression protein